MTRIPLNSVLGRNDELQRRLEMSTAEIGLSVRTTNCLEEKGIFTVEDLLHSTRDDLLSISNFGEKTLEEVVAGYLDGELTLETVVERLDNEDLGGFYKQTAKALAKEIKDLAIESQFTKDIRQDSEHSKQVEGIRQRILDHLPRHHAPLSAAQVAVFNDLLSRYIRNEIDLKEFRAKLRDKKGVGLHLRTVRHITRELQVIAPST